MNYKILGEGGGRKVFDIGNGLVKKVAKKSRRHKPKPTRN